MSCSPLFLPGIYVCLSLTWLREMSKDGRTTRWKEPGILDIMMQNHHPNSDFIPDINTRLCYLSYHYVTHVTQNILSNASGFVLLDIYPKSVIRICAKI